MARQPHPMTFLESYCVMPRLFTMLLTIGVVMGVAGVAHALTIHDIEVKAEDRNPVAARAKAVGDAQRQALVTLGQRLGRSPEVLTEMPQESIERMVTGYEVVKEAILPDGYAATLNISFSYPMLRELFPDLPENEAQHRVMRPEPPLLVVPILQMDGRQVVWEEPNPWRSAWEAAKRDHTLTTREIVLPLGDLTDMAALNPQAAMSRDAQAYATLASRYGIDTATVVEMEVASHMDGIQAVGTIYQLSKGSTVTPPQQFQVAGDAANPELFADAVRRVMLQLEGRGSGALTQAKPSADKLKTLIPLENINQWIRIRRSLQSVSEVKDIQLIAITPSQADVFIRYEGSLSRLEAVLKTRGMRMTPYSGYWVLNSTGAGS